MDNQEYYKPLFSGVCSTFSNYLLSKRINIPPIIFRIALVIFAGLCYLLPTIVAYIIAGVIIGRRKSQNSGNNDSKPSM